MSRSIAAIQLKISCQFAMAIFASLLLLILFIKLLNKNREKISKIIVIIMVIHLLCVFIYNISDAFRVIFYGIEPYRTTMSSAMYIITWTCSAIGSWAWYLMMVYQCKLVFQNTILKISKKTIIFQIFILVSHFCCILGLFTGAITQIVSILYISSAIMTIVFLIGYLQMVYLFNRKLYKMTQMQYKIGKKSADPTIMRIMRKTTVLVTFYVILMIGYVICIVMESMNDNDTFYMIRWVATMFLTCYVGLGVFLMIRLNEGWYDILCHFCDSRCEKLCDRVTIKARPELQLAEMSTASSITVATTGTVAV